MYFSLVERTKDWWSGERGEGGGVVFSRSVVKGASLSLGLGGTGLGGCATGGDRSGDFSVSFLVLIYY